MFDNRKSCSDASCGCYLDAFSANQECPTCGRRLRLTGRSQLLQFRLTCHNCGCQSPLLSQEELQVLL